MKIELDEIMKILESGWKLYRCDSAGYQSYMKGFIDGWNNWKATEIKEEKDDDEQTFFEPLSSRYFTSSKNAIEKAVNDINRLIIESFSATATVNDWFECLGLEPVGLGETVGWNVDHLLQIRFQPAISNEADKSCEMICYCSSPKLLKGVY